MIANLEIDDALAARLEAAARARGMSFREFVRQALQEAASQPPSPAPKTQYFLKTHDFGAHVESPWTLVCEIESEEYLKKVKK